MDVRPTVLAVLALAELSALKPCTVAFAITFLAHGFFARALAGWSQGRHSFKVPRMPQVSQHLGLIDFDFVAGLVVAAGTLAVASTNSAIGEAFTIELETSYLGAATAMVLVSRQAGDGLLLHGLNFGRGLGIGSRSVLVEQTVKEI